MFHPFFGELLLNVLALVGLLVIVVLKWIQWNEKKREREFLLWRARAKEQHLRGLQPSGSEIAPLEASRAGRSATGSGLKPHFRIFRWEFLMLALVAVALFVPWRTKIAARAPASKPAATDAVTATGIAAESSVSRPQETSAPPSAAPAPEGQQTLRLDLAGTNSSSNGVQPILFSDGSTNSDGGMGLGQSQNPDLSDWIPSKPRDLPSPLDRIDGLK